MTSEKLRAAAFAAFLCASSVHAAPILNVSDSYAGNVWPGPTSCANPPSGPCAPSVTFIPGPPAAGWRLVRSQPSVPANANGFSGASAYDNGVLTAIVEGLGPLNVAAQSRFRETYSFVGPPTANYIVPFHIDRFSLSTNSSGPADLRRSRLRIDILVNNVSVASLNYYAQSRFDGNLANDFTLTPAPVPVAGVTLPGGFLSFAGVTTPDVSTSIFGPGGPMLVDLGAFTTGQIYTLDYRMRCRTRGPGAGSGFCQIGDPFSIPSAPGFDLGGLSVPTETPTPATLALFGLGALGLGLARRR
jgi:uncharacterized protein (TIGR03382 family)